VKNVEEENLNKLLVNCLLKCVIQTFALLTKNPNRISILLTVNPVPYHRIISN